MSRTCTRPAVALSLRVLAVSGCAHAPSPPPGPPLPIEAAGCAAVLTGGLCELSPDRTLRLVVDAATPADTRLSGATGTLTPGGTATVIVTPGADAVQVSSGGRSWQLAVRTPAPQPALDAVSALRKAHQPAEALAEIARALPGAPPELAGRLLGQRARILLSQGDTTGAVRGFSEALPLHQAAGRATDEVNDALALAFVQIHQTRDFAGARATLAAAEMPARWEPESAAALPVHRARLALETGDLRAALADLDLAVPRLSRLGAGLRLSVARQARAEVLQALGRHAEAVTLLRTMLAEAPASPCAQTSLRNDLAWALLRQSGEAPPLAEVGTLLNAAAVSFHTDCPRPADEASVRLNLSLFALRMGDTAAARAALDAARAAMPKPDARLALWSTDVEGRLALQSRDTDLAIERFGRLQALGGATVSAEAEWRGTVGLARALSAAGQIRKARDTFARAEALLSDQALEIPLAEGRETFFAEREAGTTDYVESLVATGETAAAMDVARRARARFLAAIRRADRLPALGAAERARWDTAIADYQRARAALDAEATGDWSLPDDKLALARSGRGERERALRHALDAAFAVLAGPGGAARTALAPPGPDERVLTWFPGRSGVLAFVADAHRCHVLRLADVQPARLLDAFDAFETETLAPARRIRVLPYGAMRSVDVHALPFRGRPLLAYAPVVYGLDLPPSPVTPPAVGPEVGPAEPLQRALIVSDPRGDLPGARGEADAVQTALGGWRITRLEAEAASGPAVREALGQVNLFHYAGHGRFGGVSGWESALPLAGESLLSVHDILALPSVPADVVLSGCETARQAEAAPLEEVGLAQAFLAAGARTAIAATRPVDDLLARELASALYANAGVRSADAGVPVATGAGLPVADAPTREPLEAALRRAQLDLHQASPTRDWAAFRILVR